MLLLLPLTFDPSVPELRPDAALLANGLHGLLRLPLGHLPLLLSAERRRHSCCGSGLHHGPSQDPGGDARSPTGTQEATDAAKQLRTIKTNELSHTDTTAGGETYRQAAANLKERVSYSCWRRMLSLTWRSIRLLCGMTSHDTCLSVCTGRHGEAAANRPKNVVMCALCASFNSKMSVCS